MAQIKNTRHERFCVEVANGASFVDAFAAAGFKPSDSNCRRLRQRPEIAARIGELLEGYREQAEVTRESIARELAEDRKLAHERGQAGAAVAATWNKAKLYGLAGDKTDAPPLAVEQVNVTVQQVMRDLAEVFDEIALEWEDCDLIIDESAL